MGTRSLSGVRGSVALPTGADPVEEAPEYVRRRDHGAAAFRRQADLVA